MSEWKVENIATLANGKKAKEISSNALYPIYGGNGIMGYTNSFNASNVVIIGRVGAYCGSVHYSKEKCWISDNAISAMAKDNNSTEYLYYLLTSLYLNRYHIGGAQPLMTQGIINNIDIPKHSNSEQKKIAGILSALDEKIEINRKINARLEELVQAIFKSWFINFEPFGGKMPEDWSKAPLYDMVETIIGGDWGKEEEFGSYSRKVLCVRGADLDDIKVGEKGKAPIRYILDKNFKQKSLSNHEIIVEISGGSPTQSTGRIAMISPILANECENSIICTNFCKALKVREPYSHYFYFLWNHLYNNKIMFIYENGSNGLKNLNLTNLLEREICNIPPKKVALDFYNLTEPIFLKIQRLGSESARLATLRDALLPKLMSGEIKLS